MKHLIIDDIKITKIISHITGCCGEKFCDKYPCKECSLKTGELPVPPKKEVKIE